LLTLLGMNAANSKYACIYCKIASFERYQLSFPIFQLKLNNHLLILNYIIMVSFVLAG
jgi:hypothetical protein